jgi:hypothetical protein
VGVFTNHDDFGNHQSVNQRNGKAPIFDVVFVQQEPAVRGEGAKEEGKIQENLNQFSKLVPPLSVIADLSAAILVIFLPERSGEQLSCHRRARARNPIAGQGI